MLDLLYLALTALIFLLLSLIATGLERSGPRAAARPDSARPDTAPVLSKGVERP